MERKEQEMKMIRTVYTEIVRQSIDPSFAFPQGGQVDRKLSQFIVKFSEMCGGEFNTFRLVDYCVFQIHKNRESPHQRSIAPLVFGDANLKKYLSMSSKQKTYMEDKWLSEAKLTRGALNSLINKREHPHAKYIYMPSDECTKKRCLNTDVGFFLCLISTLMWSPFSPTCQICTNADQCVEETKMKYPELYRLRVEKYEKR
jgi:hypothetical protein